MNQNADVVAAIEHLGTQIGVGFIGIVIMLGFILFYISFIKRE
jgi:hypothetical protein